MAKKSNSTSSKKNSQSKKTVIALAAALVLLIGGSFAWLTLTLTGTKNNVIKAGTLSLTLDDTTTEGINITEGVPVSDTTGLATTAYEFTLQNNGTIPSDFTIYLDDVALEDGETRMNDKYIKYSLIKDDGTPVTALLNTLGENPNRTLTTGNITAGTTNNYKLRLWIDSDADNAVMGTVFRGKIRIEASQVK